MGLPLNAADRPKELVSPVRRPAWVAFAALAAGIVLDRYLELDLAVWLTGAMGCLYLFFTLSGGQEVGRGPRWVGTIAVLLLLVMTGGARHHWQWSARRPDNIATLAWSEPRLVRLRGVALKRAELEAAEHSPTIPDWMQLDRSRLQVECVEVLDQGNWRPVSGAVLLQVNGHVLGVNAGDVVDVTGELSRPLPPRNPGELDFGEFLRTQNIDALFQADHPLSVQVVRKSSGGWWWLVNLRDDFRSQCELLIRQHLSPDMQSIASSLLIGDRTRLSDEVQSDFAESGTMHLLAISGLHVAILVGVVLLVCRWLNISAGMTALIVLLAATGYAVMTDIRPPVLRAVLLTVVTLASYVRFRPLHGLSSLCLTAFVLVIWHPSDLFDVGAQLSFLAVWGIIVASSWTARLASLQRESTELPVERGLPMKACLWLWGYLSKVFLVTAAVWVATLPLTIARFHLFSPIGFFVNALLIPYSAVTLVLGFLFLVGGMLLPAAAGWLAIPFDWSLQLLMWTVDASSSLSWGHFYLPNLPLWWLLGFYAWLGWWWGLWGMPRTRNWGWRGLLCWSLLGVVCLLQPAPRQGLDCTFIAVGHGNAVLLELPDGTTLLYDGGTFGRGLAATRSIEKVLWSRKIQRLDAIIISHADVDHFNGVSGLLSHVPVGTIFMAQSFLDFNQVAVVDLCDAALKQQVPIRICHAGDQLISNRQPDAPYELTILHPARDWAVTDDNANSIVLEIHYANRRLLLTGDIEGAGLTELISQHPGTVDVLMSPHHGSKTSNPPALYAWATPQYVIASTNDQKVRTRLQPVVGSAQLLTTAESGAIRVNISPQGNMQIDEFRSLPE